MVNVRPEGIATHRDNTESPMSSLPPTTAPIRRKPRTLALELVEALGDRIRDGRLQPGDKLPTEAAIMEEFQVSRTVVREAISKLQASGLVETRHGIGTFVIGVGGAPGFKLGPEQFNTLRDVIAVLELRIGVETEAAALAAQRRTPVQIQRMEAALKGMAEHTLASEAGRSADQDFHAALLEASGNPFLATLTTSVSAAVAWTTIFKQRSSPLQRDPLPDHQLVFDAVAAGDAAAAHRAMAELVDMALLDTTRSRMPQARFSQGGHKVIGVG